MSSVLSQLRKKHGFKVSLYGDDYYVRSMTLGELRRLDAMPVELKTAFMLGCALCENENGLPAIQKAESEDDKAWAARIADEVADVPTETIRALSQAVADIGKVPQPASIAKN